MNKCVDLDLIHGTYAGDGNKTVFVKVNQFDHTFYAFTVSNAANNDAVECKELAFKYKNYSEHADEHGFWEYDDLMYYNGYLYLFGFCRIVPERKHSHARYTLEDSIDCDALQPDPKFLECVMYDVNDMVWHLESEFQSQATEDIDTDASLQIPDQHLFIGHLNYAIFLTSTCTSSVMIDDDDDDNKDDTLSKLMNKFKEKLKKDDFAINAYIIDINKSKTQWWSTRIGFTDNDMQQSDDIDHDDDSYVYDFTKQNVVCTIVKHNYLLFVRRGYGDIFAININDIIESKSMNSKELKWHKIHTMPQSWYYYNYQSRLSQSLYFITKGCNVLLCSSQNIDYVIYQFRIHSKEKDIISLNEPTQEDIEDLKVTVDDDIFHSSSDPNVEYEDDGTRYCLISIGNKVLGVKYCDNELNRVYIQKVYISSIWKEEIRPKYFISKKIGSGGSSQVYLGSKVADRKEIVIKQMDDTTQGNQTTDSNGIRHIQTEEIIYAKLKYNDLSWISCKLHESVRENKRTYLILQKLGLSLQHLINENSKYNNGITIGTMSLNQVLGILDRMIIILCKLHSIGYVHNDIKPENILIGTNENQLRSNRIYLIDFGIATPFWNFKNNKHLPIQASVPFNGTFRFSSKNHHCNGFSTSRRDDLESLIYLAIYLLTGTLPWIVKNDIRTTTKKEKLLTKTKDSKKDASGHEICQNVPAPFEMALIYIQSLKFNEKPNYSYLQQLFRDLMETELATQLITANKLNQAANDETKTYTNKNIILLRNIDFWRYVNFLGCRLPIATAIGTKSNIGKDNHDVKTLSQSEDKQNANSSLNIATAVTDIAVRQLSKLEKQGTITNHPTHMSVHGMRNRFGYLIDSLTIDKGVPNKLPKYNSYAGIIVYQHKTRRSRTSKIIGKVYMLSSSECEQINKKYTRRTGQNLGGIVHGAVYYHYFQDTIFDVSKQINFGKNKLSFIRGFSFGVNGQLKCRSGAFNFIGYKLIDDKYKPLAKCEEKFIDCALKRYWNDNNEKTTTFGQFIQWDQYMAGKSANGSNVNIHRNFDAARNEDGLQICDFKENLDQIVPGYSDTDVDCNPLSVYAKVELLWETNIVPIIDGLSNQDKLKLRYVSKQARLMMNQYCLWKSKSKDPGYYICDISITSTATTLKILKASRDSQIQDEDASVDLKTMHYANCHENHNYSFNSSKATANYGKFLLVNYHPLWNIMREKDKIKHGLNRVRYGQNLKYLILLKCFGIFDFTKYLDVGNQTSSLSIIIDGNKYNLQAQWSWERKSKWMNYDDDTCLQIENSYRDGDISIMLSKGMYSRGQYQRLYTILFNCKHGDLNASNQNYVDDIHNDKKWKENMFCKYFYQQNVQNKWVRIVRRKIKVEQDSSNCAIM